MNVKKRGKAFLYGRKGSIRKKEKRTKKLFTEEGVIPSKSFNVKDRGEFVARKIRTQRKNVTIPKGSHKIILELKKNIRGGKKEKEEGGEVFFGVFSRGETKKKKGDKKTKSSPEKRK